MLVETHALLWALSDPDRLSPAARSALEARATGGVSTRWLDLR
ncbi:MAG: hypothetical protein ACYCX7_09050 [Solirubrobacteraceae bacterium]